MEMRKKTFKRKLLANLLIFVLILTQFPAEAKANDAITLPISLGGTVYDCIVRLAEPVTSTGSTMLSTGGTVCFALEFLGGDGIWYPVRANELQGVPWEQIEVSKSEKEGGEMLGDGLWKTWADVYGDRYYIEYTVTNATTSDKELEFGAVLSKGAVTDVPRQFAGTVMGTPITLPISLGGTVYDCTVRLAEPVTSTGSTMLSTGGTVCFALEFLGGDGNWYPVRTNELQGVPWEQIEVSESEKEGGEMLGDGLWKTWADVYGDRYYIEYTVTNATTSDKELEFGAVLSKGAVTDVPRQFAGTVMGVIPAPTTIILPIKIGDTVYECTADLQGYLTSSGSDKIPSGGTVCFPLMFLGGDGNWYPVLKEELQGVPEDMLSVEMENASDENMLGTVSWKTWDNGHYFLEYVVINESVQDKILEFASRLKQGAVYGEKQIFSGTVSAEKIPAPSTITLPINIGGIVYDCVADLQGYLTSSGSDNIPSGGTVCFPLMFLGGDGNWYPVLKGELQGTPDQYLKVTQTIHNGDFTLGQAVWKTWENGHWYVEYTVTGARDTEIDFSAKIIGAAEGKAQQFRGMLNTEKKNDSVKENMIVPIKIDGTIYDCFVDLKGYLTSSGSDNIPSGGTVCFPLMFQGENGSWYPVLKDELQGDPDKLLHVTCQSSLGDCVLSGGQWKTWDNGHYFVEYKIEGCDKIQNVTVTATLSQGKVSGTPQTFSGTVAAFVKIPQIPLNTSASLVIKRLAECEKFNTLSFTIADVHYEDQWPVDFETPNTSDAILQDGSIIKADLCFMVNGQWYPVRNNEVNEELEKMLTYEFTILEGEECLGTPRMTTRLDTYGDIWEFEIPVKYADTGKDFRFTLCLVSEDGTKVGSVYEVSGTVQNGNSDFIVTTEARSSEKEKISVVWYIIGGIVIVALLGTTVIVSKKKKKKDVKNISDSSV